MVHTAFEAQVMKAPDAPALFFDATTLTYAQVNARANRAVLLLWAGCIGAALFVAMIPAFLGLLVALPVLGHATWHLYKRAIAG